MWAQCSDFDGVKDKVYVDSSFRLEVAALEREGDCFEVGTVHVVEGQS